MGPTIPAGLGSLHRPRQSGTEPWEGRVEGVKDIFWDGGGWTTDRPMGGQWMSQGGGARIQHICQIVMLDRNPSPGLPQFVPPPDIAQIQVSLWDCCGDTWNKGTTFPLPQVECSQLQPSI